MRPRKTPLELCLVYAKTGLALYEASESLRNSVRGFSGLRAPEIDRILREARRLDLLAMSLETPLFVISERMGVTPKDLFGSTDRLKTLVDQYQNLLDNKPTKTT